MPAPDGDTFATISPPAALHQAVSAIGHAGDDPSGTWAWNPLPWPRRGLVTFAWADAPPPAVVDQSGRRFPTQASGREFIVDLAFAGLEALQLAPWAEPVAGVLWEVSADVLDNGVLRAEFDRAGAITRLCVNGRYVSIDGALVSGPDAALGIEVIESGPVRGRVRVRHAIGTIVYSLIAHEPLLRIELEGALEVRHAVTYAGEARAGAFWSAYGEPDGPGLAMIGARASASAQLALTGPAHYALTETTAIDWTCGRRAVEIAVAPRAQRGPPPSAEVRVVGLERSLVFVRTPPPGWSGELALVDESGRSARGWLFTTGAAGEAWLGGVAGWRPLQRSAEGDAWQIDLPAHAHALLRWS